MAKNNLDPVVQSIVSLTSLLLVKILTVLVSMISNSQVFCPEKNVSSFCKCIYAIFNDQTFNDMFTNIVRFEQLGPDLKKKKKRENKTVHFM